VKELGPDPKSYIKTSHNVLLEAVRRDGGEIELRMAECVGESGEAEVTVNLPHTSAALTNMLGGEAKPLPYLLVQMNLLLHGLEYPRIDPENSLRFP
jgi:hypothetical protein